MKYADYIEKKRHGSLDFPIQYYYADVNTPHYVMSAHWHKEFEIIRVLQGDLRVFLNSTPYDLCCGDILLVEGGALHRAEPKNCVYECVVFDLNMLIRRQNDAVARFIAPLIDSSVSVKQPVFHSGEKLCSTLSSLFDLMHSATPYYEIEVYSLLFSAVSQLYSSSSIVPHSKLPHSRQAEIINHLIDWIEQNFLKPITLDELASVSGLSSKYLCRVFKEYTSKSPIQYINDLRIENACHEMAVKGKSVTEAAFDSGFNNLSYFCKTFKNYKGVTPTEYKKA